MTVELAMRNELTDEQHTAFEPFNVPHLNFVLTDNISCAKKMSTHDSVWIGVWGEGRWEWLNKGKFHAF